MFSRFFKAEMPTAATALPGRDIAMPVTQQHLVLHSSLVPPFPEGSAEVVLGMGCFWGAERCFWQLPGVITTAVGYAGGFTPNPTYEEVCSGMTGHTEVVRVIFDPDRIALAHILKCFWESHDPTQGMRQGNDVGTQYRSALYCSNATELALAEATRARFQQALQHAGRATITTEITLTPTFYYAEDYHQQYLAKHPNGYCGLGGTGVILSDL